MKSRRPPQDRIDAMCEAVQRLGNRSKAAVELDLPRSTVLKWTKHIRGSKNGGGLNPWHAGKHPERSSGGPERLELSDRMRDVERREREGRERISVESMAILQDGLKEAKAGKFAEAPDVAADLARFGTDEPAPEPPPRAIDWAESGDSANVSFTSDRLVRTEAEALAFAEVDTSVWYVKKWSCGGWSAAMRTRNGQDANGRWRADSGHVKQNWTVKLELARILPRPFQDASDAIFERLANHAPVYPKVIYAKPKNPCLLMMDLFDVHFGKLAWMKESSQDYDLKIAERLFEEATDDIIDECVGREIEKILIPVGNDFFHIDGVTNETTKGTRVDTDGRYPKIIEVGEMAMIRAIERAREIAPVDVLHVPGNHDQSASWHLCRTLWGCFRNAPEVTIDTSPMSRKYFAYHRTLLGLTHGNEEKPETLPLTMAQEAKALWAETEFYEWFCGHYHSPKQMVTRPVRSQGGVRTRWLHSLSAIDSWHYRKGYVGGKRAAEAFLFDSRTGNVHGIEVSLRRAS